MTVRFVEVKTEEQQHQLANMATEIWSEYWPAIIGKAQTDYMIDKFQSFTAIKQYMSEHAYEYWFVVDSTDDGKDKVVGFTGGCVEPETNRFFISKIYLYAHERGHGYCSRVIEFYENICRTRGLSAMYLTVHKRNNLALRAYRAKGFEIIADVETDIGKGFIMDDHIMEKRLEK